MLVWQRQSRRRGSKRIPAAKDIASALFFHFYTFQWDLWRGRDETESTNNILGAQKCGILNTFSWSGYTVHSIGQSDWNYLNYYEANTNSLFFVPAPGQIFRFSHSVTSWVKRTTAAIFQKARSPRVKGYAVVLYTGRAVIFLVTCCKAAEKCLPSLSKRNKRPFTMTAVNKSPKVSSPAAFGARTSLLRYFGLGGIIFPV